MSALRPSRSRYDAAIIGGGFFGLFLADHLARLGDRVVVVEREDELLQRASLINQARIHRGYHYPRSVLTGMRSSANFSRFVADFESCVDRVTATYYAVARMHSNVTAAQYVRFCKTIGTPIAPAPASVTRLFDPLAIEAVYAVEEHVFDARELRREMTRRLEHSGVEVLTGTNAEAVSADGVRLSGDGEIAADVVFICCYSLINQLLARSGLETVSLKHEIVEMAVVSPPEELGSIGVTVMCGPFFSLMPFPPRGLHTLSHVRYTPHYSWSDAGVDVDERFRAFPRKSRFPEMIRDAARYLPRIRESRYVDSLWEVKTVLPSAEKNDSRPILFGRTPTAPNVLYVMGAKVDNVYDICDVYDACRVEAARPGG